MSSLTELLKKMPPDASKIKLGPDKTPLTADGGLDLSTNEAAILKGRNGALADKPYTSTHTAD